MDEITRSYTEQDLLLHVIITSTQEVYNNPKLFAKIQESIEKYE